MRALRFLRIKEHVSLIPSITLCPPQIRGLGLLGPGYPGEMPHLWAWAQADLASSGTGEARWRGSLSVAPSLAAACQHHLIE